MKILEEITGEIHSVIPEGIPTGISGEISAEFSCVIPVGIPRENTRVIHGRLPMNTKNVSLELTY